jgi:putative ABC transport system permease protein
MRAIAERLAQQYPKENTGWTVGVVSLLDRQVGDIRRALLVFLAAVGLLLLIACANVANLLLARGAGRRKEFAVRVAVGAGRMRLLRQLLVESVSLALVGGTVGVVLAFWLIDMFLALSPNLIPRAEQVKVDGAMLVFTFLLSVMTGVLFGLGPGLQASRHNLVEALKDDASRVLPGFGLRMRETLVVMQIALTLVLLAGAALLGQTFVRLTRVQPGFNPENLLTVQIFPPAKYDTGRQLVGFFERVTEEFMGIPGVQSVSATSAGPQFGGYEPVELLTLDRPAPPAGENPQARFYNIGPGYFNTLQVPLLRGREFSVADRTGAQSVAVVNETLAKRFWPDEDPIGKRVASVRSQQIFEIIGVVGDMRRFGLGAQVEPEIYWPYMQQPRGASYFVFRTVVDPATVIAAVRERVARIDPAVVVVNVSTMDQLVSAALKRPRFNLFILGIFAGAALLLAAVGLYGLTSYTVAQNKREFGIRIALGARNGEIIKLVVGRGLVMALLGITVGMVTSFALTRFLVGLLYGVNATDPLTFAGVALIMTAIILLACWIPARRATKVDPMVELRCE